MKKVLVTWVLVMTLGVSVSLAQVVPVEVPVVEKPQQSKVLAFSEIYVNDLPEAVMDRLAQEGAMIKQAFMAYGIDGSRIYKINVLTNDAHEQTLFLGVSVSLAQVVPVEVPVVEKPQQSKVLAFSEIYVNDLPEAVMDRLAQEGAMIKQAFMAYGIDGSRIYKINVLTNDAHEQTLFLGEDGKLLK